MATDLRRALAVLALCALAGSGSGCVTWMWATEPNPALEAAVRIDGPISVYDALEALIEAGQDTPIDREYAYNAVRYDRADTASATFARAAITGRLVQLKALRGAHLVAEVERDALRSVELDPAFRDGAARRLLGTLYVAAPASFVKHGDSERGLSMLEELVAEEPERMENQLRLAEAYLALGDPAPAAESLCRCRAGRDALRRDERALLDRLVEQAQPLQCPQPESNLDVAAPGL
jgi:hypothetical protein